MVFATDTLQRGEHRKLLALPKLSPDSSGAICLNRDVVYQDGCSKPQARIRGAVRRQACWCTGSHNLWAVSVTTRKIHQINHTLNFFSFKTLFHRGAHLILNPKPLPEIFRRPDTRLHSSFHSFSADRTSLFFLTARRHCRRESLFSFSLPLPAVRTRAPLGR